MQKFLLPELPYAYDALGTYISKDIMQLHHDKHHRAYVDKLNTALEAYPELQTKSIEALLTNLTELPEAIRQAVRNQGGGHYNHAQFWQWLAPASAGGGQPTGKLGDDLRKTYGDYQTFVDDFSSKATSVFGSGWVWLNPDLTITTSPNQDSPIIENKPAPILGLDVWEHAYYLDYTYKRADYIAAWWNVINWDEVARRYSDGAKR